MIVSPFAVRMLPVLLLLGAALAPVGVWAQQRSDILPERTDTLRVTGTGPFLIRAFLQTDGLVVRAHGRTLDTGEYQIAIPAGTILFTQVDRDSSFSFVATYRYVPLDVPGTVGLWTVRRTGDEPVRSAPSPGRRGEPFSPNESGFTHSGSITRGILAGSNRDAAIESGLRLQLDGEIVPGVRVRAALTDENTPILPEGTTRRLNQFDRVYIELASAAGTANLGDIETRLTDSRFAALDRRLQGAMIRSSFADRSWGMLGHADATAAAATSRGTFRSQEIRPVDGVQGPYRLEGDGGQRFILVLPGSERVFLDGEAMSRGLREDYTIDYTTGEITFTNRRIIGSERRIRVDFEYTANQFTRTFMVADGQADLGNRGNAQLVHVGVTAIRESDGDQFSEEFGFSADDSTAVRQAGDQSVYRSGAVQVIYDPEALYTQYLKVERTDTNGATVSVYEAVDRVPDAEEPVYRVSYTNLGDGVGSYDRVGTAANGIVYRWVGKGLGAYEPVRPLRAPLRKEMIDLRVRTGLVPGFQVEAEWAGSRFDRNTLSPLDDEDDIGNALDYSITSLPLHLPGAAGRLSAGFNMRTRSSAFTSFDRIRSVEFAREWNLGGREVPSASNIIEGEHEQLRESHIRFDRSDSTKASLSFQRLDLGPQFRADRWVAEGALSEGSWPFLSYGLDRVSSLDTLLSAGTSSWLKQHARISRRTTAETFQPYAEYEEENLEGVTTSGFTDAVDFRTFRGGAAFVREAYQMNWSAERRQEFREFFSPVIWTLQSGFVWSGSTSFNASAGMGVRTSKDGTTVLLDTDGSWNLNLRQSLSWQYQVRSERTAALQEIYIRTGPERGEYVWVDANGDGVATLDEFIPETISGEGEYVRTLFPSDSLESVTSLDARFRFDRRPDRSGVGSGLAAWIQGVGSVTRIEISERTRDPHRLGIYLLDPAKFRDPVHTLNGRLNLSQEFVLLPHSDRSDVNLALRDVRTLSDLAAGQETSARRVVRLDGRHSLSERTVARTSFEYQVSRTKSGAFSTRSYDIESIGLEPGISIRFGSNWVFSPSMHLASKRERIRGTDARMVRFPLELEYGSSGRFRSDATVEFANVRMDEGVRGLTAFELTDGRGTGSSWIWRYAFQARLNDVLTASFSYDGRLPSGGKAIHTGRFQLSARF